jgi:hypothetical protein
LQSQVQVHQKFEAALHQLIDQIRQDKCVLATILCGSLSHDTVWDKSDIDLMLVTTDEKPTGEDSVSLYADGVNVHACRTTRTNFRKMAEGSLHSGFAHSFLAKGRLLYTHDESIRSLFDQLQKLGERDLRIQLLNAGNQALAPLYKAHKWLRTRGDLDYTALWILYTATPLAKIEVLNAKMLVDREVIPQAAKLNPEFFKLIYSDLLNTKKSRKNVDAAIHAIDTYLADRADRLFGPVLEYLDEVGEARSATEIEDHFARNYGIEGVTGACEYLADLGRIGKTGLPVRLTRKSNIQVEELAFWPLRSSHGDDDERE